MTNPNDAAFAVPFSINTEKDFDKITAQINAAYERQEGKEQPK